MGMRHCLAVLAVLGGSLLLAGCQRDPERRFELRGKVVAVDRNANQVTIAHEQIPGFMDAMTMPFTVGDDWAMPVLAPGQHVEATLVLKGDRSWIEGLRISRTEDVAGAPASGVMPKIGDLVPGFALLNQDGVKINLDRYRGRPLLLTFIYTRCPLPDYCPRTSGNFSEIYRALQSKPEAERPRLLTISFDTEHDTPVVLREYAARYMHPPRFEDWAFATGTPDEIKEITGYFGLIYHRESNQIVHSLVTVLIGADGKIKRLYLGNQWDAKQVLAEM